MATFIVTKRTYNNTQPSVQCKYGPLSGGSTIATLNIARANPGEPTHGPIDKQANSATIFASTAEFTAVWNAVYNASATNPVTLNLTLVPANTRYADVTSVVPAPTLAPHVLLQSIQEEVASISTMTGALNQHLTREVPSSVEQLDKLTQLLRLGLLKLGVTESEILAGALDAPRLEERRSEPPLSGSDSEAPAAYPGGAFGGPGRLNA